MQKSLKEVIEMYHNREELFDMSGHELSLAVAEFGYLLPSDIADRMLNEYRDAGGSECDLDSIALGTL